MVALIVGILSFIIGGLIFGTTMGHIAYKEGIEDERTGDYNHAYFWGYY